MKAGNIGLVKSLAQQMPANYQSIASAVVALANDPNSVLTFARTTGATDFTRQMAAVAFASVARQDVENARLMIPSLVQAQQLNDAVDREASTARENIDRAYDDIFKIFSKDK